MTHYIWMRLRCFITSRVWDTGNKMWKGSRDLKMYNISRIGMIKMTFDIISICFNSFRQMHWNRVNVYFDNLSLKKSTKYTKIFDFRLIWVIREKRQCSISYSELESNSMLLFSLSALSRIHGFQYFLIKFLSKHKYNNRWAPTAYADTCYYLRSILAFSMGCEKCRRHSLIDSLFVRVKKWFGQSKSFEHLFNIENRYFLSWVKCWIFVFENHWLNH